MKSTVLGLSFLLVSLTASAGEYFREGWFEYPDPSTPPRVTARCVQTGSADLPCPTWDKPLRTCRASTCTGHAVETDMLRVKPTFVVSGPDSTDDAVKKAVQGVVAACAAQAVTSAKAAGAAVPSPEPGARVGAGLAAGITVFKGCIATANLTAVAAGIANQLEFKVEMPTHWARI